MNTPAPSTPVTAPRRRRWPWVLALCLAPFVVLGVAAVSYVTLDRDAAALRRHVVAATQAEWETKVQLSLGRATLGAAKICLAMVGSSELQDARSALAAMKYVSVGVYELTSKRVTISREQFFHDTDRAMQKRGWTRLVGVADGEDNVLVYVEEDAAADAPVELCVAVVSGRDLVIASTSIDPDALQGLIERHAPTELRAKLKSSARL